MGHQRRRDKGTQGTCVDGSRYLMPKDVGVVEVIVVRRLPVFPFVVPRTTIVGVGYGGNPVVKGTIILLPVLQVKPLPIDDPFGSSR